MAGCKHRFLCHWRVVYFHFAAIFVICVDLFPPSQGELQDPLYNSAFSQLETALHFVGEATERRRKETSNSCHSIDKFVRDDHARFPRHARGLDFANSDEDNFFSTAVYFNGSSGPLLFKRLHDVGFEFPRQRFTLETWVKPEGGQASPAVITELYDKCKTSSVPWGWSLYIDVPSPADMGGAEFKFSLRTDRSIESTTTTGRRSYEPNTWIHVAVTYDGSTIKLYLNGVMVDAKVGQRGAVFSLASQRCKEFSLGGSLIRWAPFRGALHQLRVYGVVRSQEEIASSAVASNQASSDHIVISENFESILVNWSLTTLSPPATVSSDVPIHPFHPQIMVPKCGLTVCDHPDIAQNYINNWEFRGEKTLRYRPIVLAEDDGTNPTLTPTELQMQHGLLSEAYRPHNITWRDVGVTVVRNSWLRRRPVLSTCERLIGNNECNIDCNQSTTGFDGGDCDTVRTSCEDSLKGDGVCQPECNRAYHDWDREDCCDPEVTDPLQTCFDPTSYLRAYISAAKLKSAINISSEFALNVFFVEFVDASVEGFATMPWDVNALDIQGGVVLQGGSRLSNNSLIHETGHVLGLLHVHHGISETTCAEPCHEWESSLETGDLVGDTNPTPTNLYCRDPLPAEIDLEQCAQSQRTFIDTPFRNYMSYAGASCTNHFTAHQGARMHCYVDLAYASWNLSPTPGTIPLPPRVVSEEPAGSVTIAWVPPLTGHYGRTLDGRRCPDCTMDNAYVQYARTASSNIRARKNAGFEDPMQVTGPPDAIRCGISDRAWMVVVPWNPVYTDCYVDLTFDLPVVPARLSIWANFVHRSREAISNVTLLYEDNSIQSLGPISVDCDIPYTTRVFSSKKLTSLRIYVRRVFISIDAVQIVSVTNVSVCQSCAPHRYRVIREPSFPESEDVIQEVSASWFVDRWVQDGVTYSYRVQPMGDDMYGLPSPQLDHYRGQPFCGNGRTDRDFGPVEQCDDGNQHDGDGCNKECQVERYFMCDGEPSRCRRYEGDGICEAFEHAMSERDCGFYTPPGFTDQWADSASANPDHIGPRCPVEVLVGEPRRGRECASKLSLDDAWHPCGIASIDSRNIWLKLSFPQPVIATSVIIHLAGISVRKYDTRPRISVELLNHDSHPHTQQTEFISVSCQNNPVHFNISHDLSRPFSYTQFVRIRLSSPRIALSGIRLRSREALDPITLSACEVQQVYNPSLGQCMDYQCARPLCSEPNIRNANVTCSGIFDGDTCNVKCIVGYRPSLPTTLTCVDGTWEGAIIMCKPVDCGMPDLDSNVAIAACPTGTTFGHECSFKCIPPAKLQGTHNRLRCEEDGLFSLAESFCQVLCDAPPTPAQANLQSPECRSDGHNVGSACKFKCKSGFRAVNNKGRATRTVWYRCSENSTWIGPKCQPVACPTPDPQFHGLYNCTNGFVYKSQCTLHCPDETSSSAIMCNKYGEWDREFELCDSSIVCPEPAPQGDVIITCLNGHAAGSRCWVTCRLGSSYQIALEGATYRERGLLENDNAVVCTVGGKWYPDLSGIQCHQSCWEPFVDDNQCDIRNNRAYCLWDGGACCPSTAPGGKVTLFQENCGRRCECLDPLADENVQGIDEWNRDSNRPPQ